MTQITQSNYVTVNTILSQIELYKTNPSAIQRLSLDLLDEITNSAVNIVEPTSPFVFLMENSSVNTAAGVNEANSVLLKQYPSLAQTKEDLYRHMSDKQYIDQFSSPSTGKFKIVMMYTDITNKMVWDPNELCYRATFPRDTHFKVDDYIFTLLFPIDIRRFENGVIQITHDASIESPIDDLKSNVIVPQVRRDIDNIDWIIFELDVRQFAITSTNHVVQQGSVFSQDISFKDKYYMARVFQRNDGTNGQWKEMLVTYTDQVYNLYKPTAAIKIYESYINVSIPMIYVNSGLVQNEVRIDIYTTKGKLTVNFNDYSPSSFQMVLEAIDEARDFSPYTSAMGNITYYGYSSDVISGGSDAVDFETLKDRVITGSTGPNIIPITNQQVTSFSEKKGFTLVKNIDTVTNRIFLATQKLPKPTNDKLTTSANIGISPFITNMDILRTYPTIKVNNNRATILPVNLYKNDNGIIRILRPEEVFVLKQMTKSALITEVNNNSYLYSPYYYVLDDTDNEFSVRAYDLDNPEATNLSFVSQNQTLQLLVNTDTYTFTTIQNGFRLTIKTASGNYYKDMDDAMLFTQLAYTPVGENRMAYINGELVGKDADNNRIWTFDINTNYDLNAADQLRVVNSRMFDDETVLNWTKLFQTFHIFHATTSITTGFVPDAADLLLGKFILPPGTVANTHETIDLRFGKSLDALWTRSRSMASGLVYRRYTHNVPAYYQEDVYATDPITGSIFSFDNNGQIQYNKIHSTGDPVLDNEGKQVYLHEIGDVMMDLDGNPIINTSLSVDKEIDMLFIDGRHYFVDDPSYVAYNKELVQILDNWIVNDLKSIQDVLLEQSYIFFYPKTTLGTVKVFTSDQGQDILPAEQSPVIDLYVKSDIYNDTTIRSNLISDTVKILDTYIGLSVVNIQDIGDALKKVYGQSVQSLKVSNIGGSKDYQILTLADEQYRLCLKKILTLQLDGSLIMKEDVIVNFYRIP